MRRWRRRLQARHAVGLARLAYALDPTPVTFQAWRRAVAYQARVRAGMPWMIGRRASVTGPIDPGDIAPEGSHAMHPRW